VQCPEYFIFAMDVAGKKLKRLVLKTEPKTGLFMRLLGTLRYTLSIIF
jgi:hypothetical protein